MGAVYVKTPAVRPGVTVGDLIDVVTPFVLILLYALVGRAITTRAGLTPGSAAGARLLLTLGGFALVLGHGMHVAANSIHDAIDHARIPDPVGLVNWWDEHVSHYLMDGSKVALCLGLTVLEGQRDETRAGETGTGEARTSALGLLTLGAVAYGFLFFAAAVEGQTVPLMLPFCGAYFVGSLLRGRPFPPVRRFYTLGALVSILFFAFWGIWHRGFPEFSAEGLIP
jgi:hypothetical protein